jgi:rubrerythrin
MKKKPEIKSWKNLESAFAGESMAYQKYRYFAKIANKNGHHDVAKLFEETAKHENAHAEAHLRNLYPYDVMSTEEILKIARDGEKFEYTEMYPQYAKVALEEGESDLIEEFEEQIRESKLHAENFDQRLKKVQKVFEGLAKVEEEHFKNYQTALDENNDTGAKSFSESDEWIGNNQN